jgi:predicted nucleic acid-binding protein
MGRPHTANAKRKKSNLPKLLFIDANIWLDFYRARSEAALKLLDHVETVADRVITTYQLEMEFKKNRQYAIAEGLKSLAAPPQLPRHGVFSNAKDLMVAQRATDQVKARVVKLKKRLVRILENPTVHDPVHKVVQRVFHRDSPIALTRQMPIRRAIKRQAMRRFLMGYPPRKAGDTSYGDAINWEWMIHCALSQSAELVIVTRDADYGLDVDDKSYVNDFLRHEFSERVSRKRDVMLCRKLSEALKAFNVSVSPAEVKAETAIIGTGAIVTSPGGIVPAGTIFKWVPSGVAPTYPPDIMQWFDSDEDDDGWLNLQPPTITKMPE